MDKLLYYAATSPEKLDRIGDYLAQRIERYLSRSRFGFVSIGMEAMDHLLKACPSQISSTWGLLPASSTEQLLGGYHAHAVLHSLLLDLSSPP